MGIIKVFVKGEDKFIEQSLSWCTENNITISKYEPVHTENAFGRATIIGFNFYFNKEEDAVAFKLKWV